jgi:ribonuclease Z
VSFELLILGSNSAAFAHRRHHTSQYLKIQDTNFLIDCGEGTQLLLKRHKIKLNKIDHIFISHLHGDHYFGLIGLLSTMHLFGRQKTLQIVGPPGLSEIITLQLRYSETALAFDINFKEYKPGQVEIVFEDEKLKISTLPMDHRVPCSGYLFQEKPKPRRINAAAIQGKKLSFVEIQQLKNGEDVIGVNGSTKYSNKAYTYNPNPSYSYAYCSDSRLKAELVNQLKGVDLLYHEATFAEDMRERAEETFHSTAKQAAWLAGEAQVGKLILGHFSARYKELDPIIDEARTIFENSELAIEGHKFRLDEK